ncbi:Type I phosphodiesterase / nucleotide pyrophosphatase [Methylobacterium sp. UNC378MF]|uniref:alkaline phosphatase family protein n=1 Tax=Methylobacterium sp. UNC378MF TaxID=1502748 RepID=UPI00088B9B53|nr:alkaline phosphatase family protein [Methylobacterium sp. UNC378MF]SDA23046.1 Type I phosphodiesterase / nucleotide pyrophosphatase [Methylobacterium sp. UNC378MF]
MRRALVSCLVGLSIAGPARAEPQPRNVVLFIADGLRDGLVSAATTPAMDGLMKAGVRFTNTHSLFPTFTMPNATAMATGHMLGDTGQFGNTIYTAFPVPGPGESLTPFLESDPVLGDVDAHFAGNYLNEETILRAAHARGFSTASIGKLGPSLVFDHTARSGQDSVLVDDSTGRTGGIPLGDELGTRLNAAGLPLQAPTRGANGQAGTDEVPGTLAANVEQQAYFTAVATKAVLPLFKARGTPFVLVYWSRDPDGTQHNQGDSLGRLVPGINGPTSLAAIRNADSNLAALKAQGLAESTDVIVTSDHGFSTISKESATSFAASQSYRGVPKGQLPPGFLAVDLAHDLGLGLFDPDAKGAKLGPDAFPSRANGLIGADPAKPAVVVAANGGSDLVYLPEGDRALARRVVEALSRQDYVSGLFVSAALGPIPGTLPLSAIALDGSALTPMPAIVVNFRSFSTGCADPTTCGVEVSDTGLQQGQGMHGSFSRADTRNVMGAMGPSFRAGLRSPVPASNADLGKTIAQLLGLTIPGKGRLVGRVLTEALANGGTPTFARAELRSEPDAAGHVTVLAYQTVGETRYWDAAGYPGRTLGLDVPASPAAAEAH